ncbi:unnamed protein product [Closterium sp. Yama58-4]|nr:unnamed protein product [Closterium sp. Yama58-4]
MAGRRESVRLVVRLDPFATTHINFAHLLRQASPAQPSAPLPPLPSGPLQSAEGAGSGEIRGEAEADGAAAAGSSEKERAVGDAQPGSTALLARGREPKAAAVLVDPLPEARNRFSAVIDKISRLYAGSDSDDDDDDGGMNDGRAAAEGADGGRAGQRGDQGAARGGEGEGGEGEEGWEGWEEGGEWEEEYDTDDPFIDDSDLKEYFSSNRKAKRAGFFVNRSDSQHSPPRGGTDRGKDVRHAAKNGAAVADHARHMTDEAVLHAASRRGAVLWSAEVAVSEVQCPIRSMVKGCLASAMGPVVQCPPCR